jgi:beta-glucosidase
VIGPSADSTRVLLGNYAGTPSRATTALSGLRQAFPHAQVTYAPGMNLLREEELVPPAVFSTEDGQPGLHGEYFSNKQFAGTPSLVRVDRYVNLEPPPLSANSLAQPAGPNEFSVRWTGFLTPLESGTYQLRPTASANKLWLDDKLVINSSSPNSDSPKAAILKLEKGHRYGFKLESVDQDDGGATLMWLSLIPNPVEPAVAAAKAADVVIAFAGITSQLEGEELQVSLPGFKGGDRTSLDLPAEEEELLKALKNTGKPLVIVLMNGSALSVNWADKNANAILETWYPGEEGGAAIAETLAGVNNPAGRLPVTFYKSVEQLPPFEDYSMQNRTYRYFSGQPLYPFGYGLSYSRFRYSNVKLSKRELNAGEPLAVEVNVKNDSQRQGDEVVQLYLAFPVLPGAPRHALRGFQRVHLAPRETRHVQLTLNDRDLSLVNEAGERSVAPGTYRVIVGGGQPGTAAQTVQAEFTIRGQRVLPD